MWSKAGRGGKDGERSGLRRSGRAGSRAPRRPPCASRSSRCASPARGERARGACPNSPCRCRATVAKSDPPAGPPRAELERGRRPRRQTWEAVERDPEFPNADHSCCCQGPERENNPGSGPSDAPRPPNPAHSRAAVKVCRLVAKHWFAVKTVGWSSL